MKEMIFKKVPLNSVKIDDFRFKLHSSRHETVNWASHMIPYFPVWLQEMNAGFFRIVDGFGIVGRIAQTNQFSEFPAFIFPDSTHILQLWDFRLHKRLSEDNLSPFAFIETLVNLQADHPDEPGVKHLSEIFGQVWHSKTVTNFQKLKDFEIRSKQITAFTEPYSLGMKEIDLLLAVNKTDFPVLSTIFNGLRLKGNKLTSIVELFLELKHGFDLKGQELLDDSRIRQIINQVPIHQRYGHIKALLMEMRFPKMAQLTQAWSQTTSEIEFPDQIEVRHDPEFESDNIQLILNVSSPLDLRTQLEILKKKATLSSFEQLFDFV